MRGERWSQNPTGNIFFEVQGGAGGSFASFVSPALSPVPIPIPPVAGQLGLDITNLHSFVNGSLDAQGRFRLQLSVPGNPALVDVPIYLQGIGTGLSSSLGFGVPHDVGVQR